MSTTTNLGLLKPEGINNFSVEHQNGNMDILDAVIKALQDGTTPEEILAAILSVDVNDSGINATTINGIPLGNLIYGTNAYGVTGITDADSPTKFGLYQLGSPYTNAPTAATAYLILHTGYGATNYGVQIAFRVTGDSVQSYVRTKNNNVWTSWAKLWNADNDGSGSGLDADKIDGLHFRNTSGYLEYSTDGVVWNPTNQAPSGTALPATTGTMTVTMDGKTKVIVPTGSCTFNTTADSGNIGDICTFEINTIGTTSRTLTWGSYFKATGALATGTISDKNFTVTFVKCTATHWFEIGRSGAI